MPKKRITKSNSKEQKPETLTNTLTKNLIELQKIHTNLAEKFDSLSKEISALLKLFEKAASDMAKQQPDKSFEEKINKLLEQNKIIARGITLIREREEPREEQPRFSPSGRPLPRF